MNLDYRNTLKEAFFERRSRNPSYSMRAYARDLGIQVSNLSLVLNRKRGMSVKAASQIADRLGMNESEKNWFCTLVSKEHSRSVIARERASNDIAKAIPLKTNVSPEVWNIVGSWHYFAIMEFLRLPHQCQKPSSIAEALHLNEEDVTEALERLVNVGMLKEDQPGYVVTEAVHWSPDGIPSEVTRKAHDRILTKAKDALYQQSVSERDFTSMMFTLDPADLPEAKAEIRSFIQNFLQKYSNKSNAQKVYSLNVQLYNLTTGIATQEKT